MNLVFITDAWRPITGGGQKLYEEVLTRLAKRGWQITFVTRSLPGYCPEDNLRVVRLDPQLSFFNPIGRLLFIFTSFFYCLKYKPDIFMATTWLPALTLQLIKLVKKTPVVLLAIGFGSRFKWAEDIITKKFKYDLVITDDKTLTGAVFIPNGVDLPRRQAGIPKHSKFTFLFVGRNEPRKGVEFLQQAFLQVKRHYPNVQLRLFGPGFKLASQEQLDKEMFKAHCLVLPSLREGHPLILFEAWAHKLPVIATSVGSVPQFVNPKNGYLIPAGDVSALTQAMVKAINDKGLAKKGESGFSLVKNYTWDKTADAYNQALTNLSSPDNQH